MAVVSILLVLAFSTVLSIIEIPKMLKSKLYKEIWVFSIFLFLGTVLAILKSLDVVLPNPSDFIAWVYSPFREAMKTLLE